MIHNADLITVPIDTIKKYVFKHKRKIPARVIASHTYNTITRKPYTTTYVQQVLGEKHPLVNDSVMKVAYMLLVSLENASTQISEMSKNSVHIQPNHLETAAIPTEFTAKEHMPF